MKIGYTIHSIYRRVDPLKPGVVRAFADEQYTELLAMGAIRAATQDEIALSGLAAPAPVAVQNVVQVAPEPAPVAVPVIDKMAELKARAEALGVKFNKNVSETVLMERVHAAEAEAAKSAGAADPATNTAEDSGVVLVD